MKTAVLGSYRHSDGGLAELNVEGPVPLVLACSGAAGSLEAGLLEMSAGW
jgi:hypothetical protein